MLTKRPTYENLTGTTLYNCDYQTDNLQESAMIANFLDYEQIPFTRIDQFTFFVPKIEVEDASYLEDIIEGKSYHYKVKH